MAISSYMVWDTLYGIDNAEENRPSAGAGRHEISDDKLTWTFRCGELLFTNNDKVRAVDCVTSIARWSKRDPVGQQLRCKPDEAAR